MKMWKIYVGNLDARIRERDLADEFSVYGLVRSVWVARHPPGYAFIELDTRREADDAVSALDGKHGWRVEMSRRSSGGHKSKPYSSENRCRECGSSRHYTKDCRSQGARGSYRRSSSPRTRTIVNRCDFPRKRERSISPETVCIKISQNDEGNSPTNEHDAPRQDERNTFSERYHSRSPNDQEGSADECIVPRKRERKRSPDPSKSPRNNQDSSHANENDAPREFEGDASPEHYPSSSQNDEDGSADECSVPRKREHRRSPGQYPSRSQNDQDGSHADKSYMEGKHECGRSPEHDLVSENYNDNSDVDANVVQMKPTMMWTNQAHPPVLNADFDATEVTRTTKISSNCVQGYEDDLFMVQGQHGVGFNVEATWKGGEPAMSYAEKKWHEGLS